MENSNVNCSSITSFSLKASSPEGSKTKVEHEQENERQKEQGDHEENTQTQQGEGTEEEAREEEIIRGKERDFPDAFYCPLTGEIMKDPVVHPDGKSFERSAVAADTENIYYPNRALQAIIQNEEVRRNAPFQRTIDSVRRSISTISLTQEFNPLPEQYYCSITLDIMKNPVIDPDGHTFDRRAIVNWIKKNGNSPATRKVVTLKQLYKNTAIMDLLEEEASRDDASMHPFIRQWKEQKEVEEDEDDEADLEEGDHDTVRVNNRATVTPVSMEEIEENRLRRLQRERYLQFRALVLVLLVGIGFLRYPYLTILIVVVTLIVTYCLERMRAQLRRRQRSTQERADLHQTN